MYSVSSCFRKFEKETISFVVSFRLSVHLFVRLHRTTQLLLTDFHEILYMCIFRKSVEKILMSLKSDKNNRYFKLRTIYIFDHISFTS